MPGSWRWFQGKVTEPAYSDGVRNGMRFSAATFHEPQPDYLDEIQLSSFNCFPYCGSRLQILGFGEAYVSVAIADCHRARNFTRLPESVIRCTM